MGETTGECLCVDITLDEWFYGDSLGWELPNNIFIILLQFIRILRDVYEVLLLITTSVKVGHKSDKKNERVHI